MKSAPPAGIIGFPGAAVGAIPFVFPFAPLGLGLFDTDPQRLLSLLHHQSALAEEALRYRSLLFGAGVGSPSASQPGVDFLPLLDEYKEPLNLHAAGASATATVGSAPTALGSPFDVDGAGKSTSTSTSTSTTKVSNTIRVRDGLMKEGFSLDEGEEMLLRKPHTAHTVGTTFPMASTSCSPSASSSAFCDPESQLALFRDVHCGEGRRSPTATTTTTTTATATVVATGDTKCHICMANFPSAWLLEQHAALQHPHLTIHDDKPYLCGLCGQKSRYACCRYRTVLTKHHRSEPGGRSRVPADKLFTCDVCGMQFRYLKSFKKHRLNHALERLHGKKTGVPAGPGSVDSEPAVSSTNEGAGEATSSSGLVVGDLDHKAYSDEQDDTVSDSARKQTSPVLGGGETQLERYQTASAAVAAAHASAAVRSMEAESSGGGLLQHCHAPSTSAASSAASSAAAAAVAAVAHANANSAPGSLSHTLSSLINAETIPHHRLLGLDPQEASILNFLRVDAAEKQRDRRFACPFCGKCVRSKENLKLHVRKHTGERPFVCLFCGRAFGGKSDLTRHLRIHTGERPYHCEACGKCFARADYLSKHLTTHVHQLSPRP
ncbi:hypothetical protein ZHAS_00007590 [Anopheles sinensis]|uniref:C2H2-type domain-containing protein n=1 Tax=Anopheles sinensis TaxID=74873 RepID=A0A084VQ47_ANOSI|nr:hypothetical protein ZHAS_00007590 [Anopheles sinensis]